MGSGGGLTGRGGLPTGGGPPGGGGLQYKNIGEHYISTFNNVHLRCPRGRKLQQTLATLTPYGGREINSTFQLKKQQLNADLAPLFLD